MGFDAQAASFSDVLGSMRQQGDRWHLDLSENWLQGRTAYGGLGAALAVKASKTLVSGDKPLRSLLTSFVGPLQPGDVSVTASLLREGKTAAQVDARVWSGKNIATTASAVFGASRPEVSVDPPGILSDGQPDDFTADGELPGRRPGFIKNFDVRWKGNGLPWSGAEDRRVEMWVRHRDGAPGNALEKLIAIADVPPGVILSWYESPTMLSSLTWALDLLCPAESIEGDWFYLCHDLIAAQDGYSQQSGRIYDQSGRLVALSHQCMVYFEVTQSR